MGEETRRGRLWTGELLALHGAMPAGEEEGRQRPSPEGV
jgi:hypothetical protein